MSMILRPKPNKAILILIQYSGGDFFVFHFHITNKQDITKATMLAPNPIRRRPSNGHESACLDSLNQLAVVSV